MDFYTFVLRKIDPCWVAMCLENGLAGQGGGSDEAVGKLKEAVVSLHDALKAEKDAHNESIPEKNLHDFLCSVGNNQEIEKGRKTNALNNN